MANYLIRINNRSNSVYHFIDHSSDHDQEYPPSFNEPIESLTIPECSDSEDYDSNHFSFTNNETDEKWYIWQDGGNIRISNIDDYDPSAEVLVDLGGETDKNIVFILQNNQILGEIDTDIN